MIDEKALKKIHDLEREHRGANLDIRARQQWIDWMSAYEWSVMGVLKFRDLGGSKWKERKATGEKAQQTLKFYWKKIDKIYFGSRAERRNEHIRRSIVLHKGAYQDNTHYHFLAYHPYYSAESLSQTLKEVWEQKVFNGEYKGKFEPVKNTTALLKYMTHEWKVLEQDTFEVFELNLEEKHRFGYHNSVANRNDIRNRRQKIHSLTDSR